MTWISVVKWIKSRINPKLLIKSGSLKLGDKAQFKFIKEKGFKGVEQIELHLACHYLISALGYDSLSRKGIMPKDYELANLCTFKISGITAGQNIIEFETEELPANCYPSGLGTRESKQVLYYWAIQAMYILASGETVRQKYIVNCAGKEFTNS
jgi:hypothetical protein